MLLCGAGATAANTRRGAPMRRHSAESKEGRARVWRERPRGASEASWHRPGACRRPLMTYCSLVEWAGLLKTHRVLSSLPAGTNGRLCVACAHRRACLLLYTRAPSLAETAGCSRMFALHPAAALPAARRTLPADAISDAARWLGQSCPALRRSARYAMGPSSSARRARRLLCMPRSCNVPIYQ